MQGMTYLLSLYSDGLLSLCSPCRGPGTLECNPRGECIRLLTLTPTLGPDLLRQALLPFLSPMNEDIKENFVLTLGQIPQEGSWERWQVQRAGMAPGQGQDLGCS